MSNFRNFYAYGGSESISKMFNFTASEFRHLFCKLHPTICSNRSFGRRKRPEFKPMDMDS